MRYAGLMLVLVLSVACSSRTASENETAEPIVKYGVINAKEEVSVGDARSDSKVSTSVHASVSSGGGVSLGIGFLLSELFSGDDDEPATRYDIALEDGDDMTIYHVSSNFEVDDCVEITVYPDAEEKPPEMKRSKTGCD